ncbi:MAG: hypothetical protein BWZ02_03245 [Lentisphaerae bacterium ADurb.BinA184]|nr:MAG: hypothetical protein BWZ02_03245 [Lentisphaerae bacterium ADurb.BinA184]
MDGLLAETDDDTPPPAPEPAYAPDALLGNLLVFTEFWSDVSLVYGGGYAQYAWDPKTRQYREFWRREHLWEACRWLTPGVQLISPGSIVAPYQELPPPPKAPAELAEALVGPPGEPDVAAETLDDAPAAAADGKVITPPDMFRFLMERGITPHFHAGTRTTPDMADRLKALCDEMLDDQGQWRE